MADETSAHWFERFTRVVRPIKGALHTVVAHEDFLPLLAAHHERWVRVNPDLGLPLHLVRATEAEQHQGSRRVGSPVPRRQGCFPFSKLAAALRAAAKKWL